MVAAGILLLIIVTAIIEPKFRSVENVSNILRQFGPLSLVALGMTFVIEAGYLDLSLGGVISLIAVVIINMIKPLGQIGALLFGLFMGAVLGALNGGIIWFFGANRSSEALFITYGTGMVCTALALMFTGGAMQKLPNDAPIHLYEVMGKSSFGIIPVSFLIFFVSLLILYIFESKTFSGRSILLAGGNPEAAELAAIPVRRSVILAYTFSGIMAALGAIVLFSRLTTATPSIGEGFEVNAITAVLIGGTSLKGGKGSILLTVFGVVLLTVMSNCLNLLRVSTYTQTIVKGAILIIAIWLDKRRK